jgi:transposase
MTQGVKGTFAIRYISVSDLADWYSLTSIYRLIHQLDFSWITSRSKYPKRSQAAQEGFKKIQN